MLQTDKEKALAEYKQAREEVKKDYNDQTYKTFCEKKRKCMLLGVRI